MPPWIRRASVRAMMAVLARQRPASTAEALRMLRRGYPDIPLAMRIAALCAARSSPASQAEIGLPHAVVGEQLNTAAGERDPSVLQHVGAAREP